MLTCLPSFLPCAAGAIADATKPSGSLAIARPGTASAEFRALPPAVVVHGRRGPNSNINGVYIRDYSWHGEVGPCYRYGGAGAGQKAVFLYFEGEWRIGPSPEQGSVWAFARSGAISPLAIDAPWEVWDGRRVAQDP